jgi:hypothetical protein
MQKPLIRRAEVGCCGTCLDTRGRGEQVLVEGARRSSLDRLADWTLWAENPDVLSLEASALGGLSGIVDFAHSVIQAGIDLRRIQALTGLAF